MKCQKCDFENSLQNTFCVKCGTELLSVPPVPSLPPTPPPPVAMRIPPVTPAPPAIPGGTQNSTFQQSLEKHGSLLGLITLALLLIPWGMNITDNFNNGYLYASKLLVFLNSANFALATLVAGTPPVISPNFWNLFNYFLLFIPLAAFSLCLWKTKKRLYPLLTLVFSLLGGIGLGRCLILSLTHPADRIFTFLNIFQWLCFFWLIFLCVISSIVIIQKQPDHHVEKPESLSLWLQITGMISFILFFLPLQIIDPMLLWKTTSVINMNSNPFSLFNLFRYDLKTLSMGLSISAGMGYPFWIQLIYAFFSLLIFTALGAAITAILQPVKDWKNLLLTIIFSAVGFIFLPLRCAMIPFEGRLFLGPIPLDSAMRVASFVQYTLFYYLLMLSLIALIVLGAILLSKRKQSF